MKIKRLERMREAQREYHRRCTWQMKDGIYTPYAYEAASPEDLPQWNEVGFIQGDRRVLVFWQHPRHVYAEKIDDASWLEAGDRPPEEDGILGKSYPNYKRVGRSRKKAVSFTAEPASDEWRLLYDRLSAARKRMEAEGIDTEITPSWHRERQPWATRVYLVTPGDIRNESDLKEVVNLVRRLLQGETSLEREFPGYRYGRSDWLADHSRESSSA